MYNANNACVVVMIEAWSHYKYRVSGGVDDASNEFPYVLSLQTEITLVWGEEVHRACTGTLIAPEWVLTHCLLPMITIVRFGNMTVPKNATHSMWQILKRCPFPDYTRAQYFIRNDIGLLLIESISMLTMGILSSVGYRTFVGMKVRYAGLGWLAIKF